MTTPTWEIVPGDITPTGTDGTVVQVVSGGVTFSSSGSAGTAGVTAGGPHKDFVGGLPVLRMDATSQFGHMFYGFPATPPSSAVVIAKIRYPAAATAYQYFQYAMLTYQTADYADMFKLLLDYGPTATIGELRTDSATFSVAQVPSLPTPDEFHVLALKWTPTSWDLFIDGVAVGTKTGPAAPGDLAVKTANASDVYYFDATSAEVANPVSLAYLGMYSGDVDAAALTAEINTRFAPIPDPHTVTVAFGAPDHDGGAPVKSYIVRVSDQVNGISEVKAVAAGSVAFTGTTGTIEVAAINAVGEGRPAALTY